MLQSVIATSAVLQMLKSLKNLPFHILLAFQRVSTGPGCFSMGGLPRIKNSGVLQLGRAVAFRSIREPVRIEVGGSGRMRIGDDVFINDGVNVYCGSQIDVGAHTKIGDWATIYDTDFHPVGPDDEPVVRPVIIGKNVWIGARAIILAGSQIGDHAVIGAGSVVRGVVPARTVVSGIPARMVREIECGDDWVRP